MATMISRVPERQQPQYFPFPIYPLQQADCNYYSSTVPPDLLRTIDHDTSERASFRQRLEGSRNARRHRGTGPSISSPTSPPFPQGAPLNAEHMLRRKTPNETLAAGYDGGLVGDTGTQHASKHCLLPAMDTAPRSPIPSLSSERVQRASAYCGQSSTVKIDIKPAYFYQGDTLQVGTSYQTKVKENPQPQFTRGPICVSTGVDSVLNQAPLYNTHCDMARDNQVATVLQPMWPPFLGPTTLQNSGPLGPYWPNGAFEPYRPAPRCDPRYLDRSPTGGHKSPSSTLPPAFFTQLHVRDHDGNLVPDLGRRIDDNNELSKGDNAAKSSIKRFDFPRSAHEKCSSYASRERSGQSHNLVFPRRNDRGTRSSQLQSTNLNRAYSNLRLSGNDAPPDSLKTHSRADGLASAHFKERVLLWAHRIYGSLLAAIEQARRNPSNEQQFGPRQTTNNPRPPRRPYPSWTKTSQMTATNEESSGILLHAPINSYTISPLSFEQAVPYGTYRTRRISSSERAFDPSTPSLKSSINGRSGHHRPSTHANTHAGQASYIPPYLAQEQTLNTPSGAAVYAMEMLARLCEESGWQWTDGMLLNGCLAYGLGDYDKATQWYIRVLQHDSNNVEAMSNLAATLISLDRRQEAEQYWVHAVRLRPNYFEAVEHLVGLLHESHRGKDAVKIVEYVERALREPETADLQEPGVIQSFCTRDLRARSSLSGYTIAPSENGRILALVHGKGNVLYQMGENVEAAKAFEDAILIATGRLHSGVNSIISSILGAFTEQSLSHMTFGADEAILLPPEMALETARLVFPPHGQMPGLAQVSAGMSQKAAVSIVSNSLLSLAKIYQDGLSASGATTTTPSAAAGVQEILALYYLSLSLQPSPSTANNVGILLAGVQHSTRVQISANLTTISTVPNVTPGSGVALALAYYDYGLKLDPRHAHLYTNLGSLFKDIGQLSAAIRMYEKAVDCDAKFDIALANLANAVKDKGDIGEAIKYYYRAVTSNPDFAEAVCGLCNALNSVCNWQGRGGIQDLRQGRDRWHVDEHNLLYDSTRPAVVSRGWIERVVAIVDKQLLDGQSWGRHLLQNVGIDNFLSQLGRALQQPNDQQQALSTLRKALESWSDEYWEGAKVVRLVERATRRLSWQIYQNRFIEHRLIESDLRVRPQLPAALAIPTAPTVLPFHTFTCPLSAKQIRKISQRNGLRVSCSTLRAPWLPVHVFEPPLPPDPQLNVGYLSSDFNNHPLAHLMQSVFGFHDSSKVKAICYATTASDGSIHRQQIQNEAPIFHDASSWSVERIVKQVVTDNVHILVNLNGYTRGAKNEVFAARPAPIQMSFMGFAGTLGAEWCDYLLADTMAVPPQTLRPWRGNVTLLDQTQDANNDDDQQDDWVYGENIIYTQDTFFCCDHRQSAPDAQEEQLSWEDEQKRRWRMRKEVFPDLADDAVILGNFNQLYKVKIKFTIISFVLTSDLD